MNALLLPFSSFPSHVACRTTEAKEGAADSSKGTTKSRELPDDYYSKTRSNDEEDDEDEDDEDDEDGESKKKRSGLFGIFKKR
jgi:hypothetical protein